MTDQDVEKFVEIVGREFLFGRFGHVMSGIEDPTFFSDVSVVPYAMARWIMGKRTSR